MSAQFAWLLGGQATVARVTEKAVQAVADEVLAETVRDCPVDTGTLAGSYTTENRSSGDDIEIRVGTAIDYAPPVEFGTYRSSAQPHLGPALERARARYG